MLDAAKNRPLERLTTYRSRKRRNGYSDGRLAVVNKTIVFPCLKLAIAIAPSLISISFSLFQFLQGPA